jgi:RNA polymerase subunit RPABC4/transcription elongation factor Spt4
MFEGNMTVGKNLNWTGFVISIKSILSAAAIVNAEIWHEYALLLNSFK